MFRWAAIVPLLACMAMLFSCKDDDKESENTVEEVTEDIDSLEVKSQLRTYAFPYDYTESAKSLLNRMENKALSLDDDVRTVILHDGCVPSFNQADYYKIATCFLLGGNVVICEPTRDNMSTFLIGLGDVARKMYADSLYRDKIKYISQLAMQRLSFLNKGEDGVVEPLFHDSANAGHALCDVIALRGADYYIIGNLDSHAGQKNLITEEEVDSETGDVLQSARNVQQSATSLSEGNYGSHADGLAEWLDGQYNFSDDYARLMEKGKRLLKTRSGSSDLDQVTNAQHIIYSFNANFGSYHSAPVKLSYEVWAVNDTQGTDYYLVHQEVRSENSKLRCGPDDKTIWKSGWKAKNDFGGDYCYGPYMVKLGTQNTPSVSDAQVEHVSPTNSISGKTDYSVGINWGISAAFAFSKSPNASVTGSVNLTKNWTYSIPDLGSTFSYNGNSPKWEYVAGTIPKGHNKTPDTHDIARDIMRKDCTVGHSWVWKIPDANTTYKFTAKTWIDLQGFWFKHGFFKGKTHYRTQSTNNSVSFELLPPPRYKQEWMMEMYPYDKETADYLKELFPEYWGLSFSLYVVEENDRTTIRSRIDDMIYVLQCNRLVLSAKGVKSFTLRWKQLRSILPEYTYDFYL